MSDPIESLERRMDKVETWQYAKDEVEKVKSAAETQRHTHLQISLSILSGLIMLVNLWLTVTHYR